MPNLQSATSRQPIVAFLLGCLFACPGLLSGQERQEPRFSVFLGGAFLSTDLKLSFFSPRFGVGRVIDFEDDLGLKDSADEVRVIVGYRFGQRRRHELELSYLRVSRDGSVALSREVELGDTLFTVGTTVFPEVRTQDLELGYTYYLVKKEKGELGISPGIHGLRVETVLSGILIVEPSPGEQPTELPAREDVAAEYPLPVIGLKGSYRPLPRLVLRAGFRWLGVEIGEYQGHFIDAHLRLEHETFEKVGFGVGYNLISLDLKRDPGNEFLIGTVDYRYDGPEIFVRMRF
jgi:hypothetical protein